MVKRDFEACSAEGQPRTILGYRSQQIRGALPAMSYDVGGVIHSCYAFLPYFPTRCRHCEERSDEAIQSGFWIAALSAPHHG
jgi:hypothetical protein